MIRRLEVAAISGQPIDAEAARWLAIVGEPIHGRLVKAGLCRPRENVSAGVMLKAFCDAYVARPGRLKAGSLTNLRQTAASLVAFFGKSKLIISITPADASNFRGWLESRYSEATVCGKIKKARQFFAHAVDDRQIADNPFRRVKLGTMRNRDRQSFISREVIADVLAACPDARWRLIVLLARFGGLRHREIGLLRWQDIDWDRERFTIRSPKTEHQGKPKRAVPLFEELQAPLREALEVASEGSEDVFDPPLSGRNLGTQLKRITCRAGHQPWPKTFQNLRSTRQTELTNDHPRHVVRTWLGNTEAVADGHYLQVTEEHFKKAVQKAVQQVSGTSGKESQSAAGNFENAPKTQPPAGACASLQAEPVKPAGHQ